MTSPDERPLALTVGDVHLLLAASPDALVVVGSTGTITAANAVAERLFGVEHGELHGRSVHELVPLERRDAHRSHLAAYFAEPGTRRMGQSIRCQGVRADGLVVPLDILLCPVVTPAGPAALAAIRDLTDRTQMEHALRASEERLRQAAQLARLGTWELDLQTDTRTYSPELLELLGLAAPHASTAAFMEAVHPDDRAALSAAMRAALGGGNPYRARVRLRHVAGVWRTFETSAAEVTTPDGRRLLRGIVQDVTQRVTAEAEAERARAHWDAVVRHSPDWIATLDRQGVVLSANRGPTPDSVESSVVGRPFTDVLAGDCHAAFRTALAAVFDRGEPAAVDLVHLHPEGERRFYQTLLGPVREGDAVALVMATSRDVTAQRRLESQLVAADRLVAMGMLAAGVAHEVNNPLSALFCSLELAQSELAAHAGGAVPTALVGEPLRDAQAAAEAIRGVVTDLRTFARSGEDRPEVVDIQRALEPALRLGMHQLRVRARLVVDRGPTPPVLGSASRLGQVFLNLLINAAQAIPPGRPEHEQVRVRTSTSAEGAAVVEVSDTGAGMTAATMGRLFTPFFTTKPPGQGSGLGLAVSHRIVRDLGGELTVDSTPGGGTVFRVVLPAASHRAPPDPGAPEPPARRGRVLVVDDDPLLTRAVARTLGHALELTTLQSGRRALERLAGGERFDVILCDLMMPEFSGMELYRQLRAAAPEMADRVVFLTGGAVTPAATDFLAQVPNARVQKPFDAEALRQLVAARVRA
ncbi:MAG: PAS domain S-box protein [Deltaproteobacteria bacterium]|nr:PAS domain S-box protein [Deltaproteobacteria bacterium]